MSYPQPKSSDYVTSGFDFFRLNTPLSSAGDIYESEVSGHGFTLGPDSDVSKVNIAYFDQQVDPTFVNQIAISPRRSWYGKIDAVNGSGFYAPSSRPGRVLMWSDELYNADYLPTGFDPTDMVMTWFVPQLDVLQIFTQEDFLAGRNDKEYNIQFFQQVAIATTFVMIPFYGRRYAMLQTTNFTGTDFVWKVTGINFEITDTPTNNFNQEAILQTTQTVVGFGGSRLKVVKSSTDGMFDYLRIDMTGLPTFPGPQPTPLKVIVSDEEH